MASLGVADSIRSTDTLKKGFLSATEKGFLVIQEKPSPLGAVTRKRPRIADHRGSVVIVVLWVLILIAFLAAQHGEHNRAKAGLAGGAWERIQREHAVLSVVDLFSSGNWPVPGGEEDQGAWFIIEWDGLPIWCRVDDEGGRININQVSETDLREKIRILLDRYGEGSRADWITDALLDWMDEDNLVRGEGAEASEYRREGFRYNPADGPFKVFSELLLVRGMTASLFWGDPVGSMMYDMESRLGNAAGLSRSSGNEGKNRGLGLEADESVPDFWDLFTVYPKEVKRLTCLIPRAGGSYQLALVFLGTSGRQGTYRMLEKHQISLSSAQLAVGEDLSGIKRGLDNDPVSRYIPVSMLR